MKRGLVDVEFAEGCAWRAVYLYVCGRQVWHLGIDPSADRGPRVFAAFHPLMGLWRVPFFRWPALDVLRGWLWRAGELRVTVPHIRWRYPMAGWKLRLYRLQGQVLAGLDGRYGWGRRVK